ncbi:MAG: peptidoglycan-associated lipoprotein Pal [Alphaproteobacteria bacterium]|nr:peptidoglycan-associated lipoprotein Pal [Alphaproteobacteria bacterium]
MTSERLGKNIAIISAAALLLAACSTTPEPTTDTSASTETSQDSSQASGQPTQPTTAPMTAEELDAQKWGGSSQDGLTAFAGDRVFFEYDSSEITDEARRTLAKQVEWLMHYPRVRVSIEGHCDERGTREYNLALGERRANAVKNYLIALGVPASRMNTISYGKERPAVVGNGESTWSQNRRGVLRVQ